MVWSLPVINCTKSSNRAMLFNISLIGFFRTTGVITPLGDFYVYTETLTRDHVIEKSIPKRCQSLTLSKLLDILYRIRATPPVIVEDMSVVMIDYIQDYGFRNVRYWTKEKISYYFSWLYGGFQGDECERIREHLAARGKLEYNVFDV